MARMPRFILPGVAQHVIARGNNREPIFYAHDDYHFYLEKLAAGAVKHDCEIHAYVLMTNHVHLLVTPNTAYGISKLMQMIGRYYVQYFNRRYRRTGTLWEGRFKASLIDSERYAMTCYRYIEMNPVRAKMVDHPAAYPWSSYRANAGVKTNSLLSPHPNYVALGINDENRAASYRELFATDLDNNTLEYIREVTNKA